MPPEQHTRPFSEIQIIRVWSAGCKRGGHIHQCTMCCLGSTLPKCPKTAHCAMVAPWLPYSPRPWITLQRKAPTLLMQQLQLTTSYKYKCYQPFRFYLSKITSNCFLLLKSMKNPPGSLSAIDRDFPRWHRSHQSDMPRTSVTIDLNFLQKWRQSSKGKFLKDQDFSWSPFQ